MLCLLVGVGTSWAENKTGSWDLTSSNTDWTASGNETYFSQPYGFKKANGTLTNKSISDFSISGISQIKVGFKCLQNGATTSKLTIYLVDKDGKTLGNGVVVTPDNKSAASQTTYKYATFTSNITGATGFMMKVTTFGKNILINGAEYEVTYTSGGGSTPTTYTVSVANDIANGTVTTSSTTAAEGDEITLTATPNDGYEFGSWNVINASTSAAITVTNNKFTMPAANVNVSATFKELQNNNYCSFIFNTKEGLTTLGIAIPNPGSSTSLSSSPYTSGAITMTATNSSNTATRIWNSKDETTLRVYNNGGSLTFSGATIVKIEFVATSFSMNANVGNLVSTNWTGNASSVTFTATDINIISEIHVTYEILEAKTSTSLAWSSSTITTTIGVDNNSYPTLTTTPADLTGVTYSSSNTSVATINAETGVISLVAPGKTTITASYAGNETYAAAEDAMYTLTVNAAPDTRAEVNITSFTTEGGVTSVVRGNTLATSVSIDPNECSVSYAYSSNKSSVATVNENGVITAVGNGSARITVSLTVVDTENYKAGTTTSKYVDITVTAASHTATFYVDGREKYTTVVEEGKAISFPAESPEDINDKQFMGWTANPIPEPVNDEPEYVKSANMGDADVNFYAVFANLHGEGGTVSSSNLPATNNGEIVLVEGKPIKYDVQPTTSYGNPLRVYAGNVLSIYGANITEIVLEGNSSSYPITRLGLNDGQTGTIVPDEENSGKVIWKGSAERVEFKATGQARVSTMTVKFGNAYYDGYCTTIRDAEYYRINYYVSGQLAKSDEVVKDKVLEFPHVDDMSATKVFRGWTANPEIDDDSDIISVSGLRASEDICYYAVFATPTTKAGNKVWTRLEPQTGYDWLKPGNQYLFVYENGNKANVFNCTDVASNSVGNIDIVNNTITESPESPFAYITMKTVNTTWIGLIAHYPSGEIEKYMTDDEGGNGIRFWTQEYIDDDKNKFTKSYLDHVITLNTNNEWRIANGTILSDGSLNGTTVLRYVDGQFRYYNESKQPIQIYVYESIDYRDFTTNNPSVTISQYNYTTYCSKIDYKMPEDVEGKIITAAESTSTPGAYNLTTSTKYNAGDVVPAGVSLMLYSSKAEEYTIIPSMAEKDAEVIAYPDNLLVSEYTVDNGKLLTSYDYVNKDNYYYYKLTTKNKENFGWYYGETDGAPFYMSRADRAYLVIDKTKGNSIKSFVMFDIEKGEEGTLTDIESLEANDNSIAIYNLQGQRINRTDKGVYIVNGRKVIR